MTKSNKFSPEVRERAVRMVQEHRADYPSLWAAIESIAPKIGCVPNPLHEWVKKAEVNSGQRPGTTTLDAQRIKELEREVKELRRPQRHLEDGQRVFCPGGARPPFEALKRFIDLNRDTFGVEPICQVLQMAPSCYWRHAARQRCPALRSNGLRARWQRKFTHTTDSRHSLPVADNVLNRQFTPQAPNRAWVCDITYVRTRSGWLYLAAVLDLFSRKIIGWAMAPSMPAQLVCSALSMAIASRCPQPGLVVHSDRGSQYASAEHSALLARHGLISSMSRKGNCWDNAVMERFFLNLKMERVWQRDYANHAEAQADIADYIVGFYNGVRLHSTLGYCSPNQFEQQHLEKTMNL